MRIQVLAEKRRHQGGWEVDSMAYTLVRYCPQRLGTPWNMFVRAHSEAALGVNVLETKWRNSQIGNLKIELKPVL